MAEPRWVVAGAPCTVCRSWGARAGRGVRGAGRRPLPPAQARAGSTTWAHSKALGTPQSALHGGGEASVENGGAFVAGENPPSVTVSHPEGLLAGTLSSEQWPSPSSGPRQVYRICLPSFCAHFTFPPCLPPQPVEATALSAAPLELLCANASRGITVVKYAPASRARWGVSCGWRPEPPPSTRHRPKDRSRRVMSNYCTEVNRRPQSRNRTLCFYMSKYV